MKIYVIEPLQQNWLNQLPRYTRHPALKILGLSLATDILSIGSCHCFSLLTILKLSYNVNQMCPYLASVYKSFEMLQIMQVTLIMPHFMRSPVLPFKGTSSLIHCLNACHGHDVCTPNYCTTHGCSQNRS